MGRAGVSSTPQADENWEISSATFPREKEIARNDQKREDKTQREARINNHPKGNETITITDHEQNIVERQHKQSRKIQEKVTHEIASDIVIIGDSIIKNIQPGKLTRNKKVHKYTFPGKTADEIEKEINFDNLKTIPSHIIIHVGTNNLPLETATECAQKIENLATKIKTQFPYSKIGLSGITVRHDIVMSEKITKVNEEIGQICTKLNASFIDNSTIDHSCLNGSKLHLNAKGSAILAVHLIKFLKEVRHQHQPHQRNKDMRISNDQQYRNLENC